MTATITTIVTRGQVWLADLGDPIGSEQGGIRPVLVVQNDVGNRHSNTITVCPLSSKTKKDMPTHVILKGATFLPYLSTALVEQIRTIDRGRFIQMLGKTNDNIMIEIDEAIKVQTALKQQFSYDKAFAIIRQIGNIKSEISELGKRPRLMDALRYQLAELKQYCADYGMDYQLVKDAFNRKYYEKVL